MHASGEMRHTFSKRQISSPTSAFFLLLIAIFIAELAVMEVETPLFGRLSQLLSSVVDSVLLVILLAPVLWFVIIKPIAGNSGVRTHIAVVYALLKVLACVFVIECIVMLFLQPIAPHFSDDYRNVADAMLTALLCAPLLWWLLFRPMSETQRETLVAFFQTPAKLLPVLLLSVFAVDLLQEELISVMIPNQSFYYTLIDSLLTTLLAAPILWYLVVRPLKLRAIAEKTYSDTIRAQVVDAIVTTDAAGIIQSFNPAAEKIFGYGSGEIIGKPFVMLLNDNYRTVEELMSSTALTESGATLEIQGRPRDRSTLLMDISVSRVMIEGKQQFVAIMRDITARVRVEAALRESEQRFRQIFEQTEDAIMLFKPGTCQVVDANTRAEKLFGLTKTELQENGLECFTRPADYESLSSVICGIRKWNRSRIENIVIMCKDGTNINVSMRGKMMTIQGVDLCYCTFRDITDRIRIEEEARNIQAKLIQANKMTSLGLLVSGMAHEINNPNNFIMANAQLLAKAWDDALKILREYQQEHGDFLLGGLPYDEVGKQSQEMFSGIIEGTRRISDIVNNLKNFARQDRRVAERAVDVNQVVKSAVTMVYHEIKKHTSNFHLDLDENIPRVKGSNKQFEQVVINLLMNACQALPGKEAPVRVETTFDSDAGHVIILVRDEGGGMSREIISRIMEPFFTTKLGNGGTGLGLSICQSIIKEHNGLLECQSDVGKGTTFTVRLPAVRSEEA